MAFATKLWICQLNAKVSTRDMQIMWLMKVTNYRKQQATGLWKRIVRDTAYDMVAGKVKYAEERWVKWTTYHNLDLLFSSWERILDDLGFLEYDADGNHTIPDDKLRNILNFDETSLSLDGSTISRGGRPPVGFQDPRLPQVGKATSKTSQTTTMVTRSNAWGEALPPHFQFMTNAQTDEEKQIRSECILYTPNILGQFGLGEEVSCPVSLGANEKGGMDDDGILCHFIQTRHLKKENG
jgi:hypothetical protein